MKPKTTRPRMPSMPCPHCTHRLIVRNSEPETITSRELRLACTNDDCGAVFNGQIILVTTRVASERPNPAVHLPFAKPRPANDDHRAPANDDGPTAPVANNMTG